MLKYLKFIFKCVFSDPADNFWIWAAVTMQHSYSSMRRPKKRTRKEHYMPMKTRATLSRATTINQFIHILWRCICKWVFVCSVDKAQEAFLFLVFLAFYRLNHKRLLKKRISILTDNEIIFIRSPKLLKNNFYTHPPQFRLFSLAAECLNHAFLLLVDPAHLFFYNIGYQSSYFRLLLCRSNMQQNSTKQENNSIEQNAFEGWKL